MFYNYLLKTKKILLVVCLLMANYVMTQEYSFGLKAGLNYTIGNEGSEISGSLGNFSAESDLGYLAGGFGEIRYNKFFLRPEVFYSYVTSKFTIQDEHYKYNFSKINVPLLFGYNVYGPIEIYAGPSYQKIFNARLQNTEEPIELDQKNFNAQFGFKFIYDKWEVDLRYEFVPPSKNNQIVNIRGVMDNAFFDDGRLNNIMLTLNYKILDTQTYSSKEVVDQ